MCKAGEGEGRGRKPRILRRGSAPNPVPERRGQWGWEAQQLKGSVLSLGGSLRKVGWGPQLGEG